MQSTMLGLGLPPTIRYEHPPKYLITCLISNSNVNMRTTIYTLKNLLFAYIYQDRSNIAETAIL